MRAIRRSSRRNRSASSWQQQSCTEVSSGAVARLRDLLECMPAGGEVGGGMMGSIGFPMAASAIACANPNTTPLPSTRWSILCLPDSV
eukprot:3508308-Prymnesium_polylepis.2